MVSKSRLPGPYLGFFVCGGKLGFREISDQYSYKKQPSKIRHYVRKKTFSFPGGGNCPLRPPAMYGPGYWTGDNDDNDDDEYMMVQDVECFPNRLKFMACTRKETFCSLEV